MIPKQFARIRPAGNRIKPSGARKLAAGPTTPRWRQPARPRDRVRTALGHCHCSELAVHDARRDVREAALQVLKSFNMLPIPGLPLCCCFLAVENMGREIFDNDQPIVAEQGWQNGTVHVGHLPYQRRDRCHHRLVGAIRASLGGEGNPCPSNPQDNKHGSQTTRNLRLMIVIGDPYKLCGSMSPGSLGALSSQWEHRANPGRHRKLGGQGEWKWKQRFLRKT